MLYEFRSLYVFSIILGGSSQLTAGIHMLNIILFSSLRFERDY